MTLLQFLVTFGIGVSWTMALVFGPSIAGLVCFGSFALLGLSLVLTLPQRKDSEMTEQV